MLTSAITRRIPPLLSLRGIYFSQIVIPFRTVIVSPSRSVEISVKSSNDDSGINKPSLFSPRSVRALILRFSGSKYPPAGLPFSSLRRSRSCFCANSRPSLPSTGKYTPSSSGSVLSPTITVLPKHSPHNSLSALECFLTFLILVIKAEYNILPLITYYIPSEKLTCLANFFVNHDR